MKKGVQSVLFSVLVGALLLCAGCGKSGYRHPGRC